MAGKKWISLQVVLLALVCLVSQNYFAEDLVEQSKKALMNPFRLEQCLKIAESQCDRTRNNDDFADPR